MNGRKIALLLAIIGVVMVIYGAASAVPTAKEHSYVVFSIPVGTKGFWFTIRMWDPFTNEVYDYPIWFSVPGFAFSVGLALLSLAYILWRRG